jgi:CMP-N-acetylneuraminic acid synthetase
VNVLGLIPARAGSKGVPGKNSRLLGGLPLIAHTIKAALAAQSLSSVVVTTEDREIADIARKFGASVPFMRDPVLASDSAKQIDVARDAVGRLEKSGSTFDWVVLLQPTAPFRSAADIDEAVALARRTEADSVISVSPVGTAHPYYLYTLDGDHARPFMDVPPHRQRQDFPALYRRNGAVYVVRRSVLIEQGSFYGNDCRATVMPERRSLNIDSPDDWWLAERMVGT